MTMTTNKQIRTSADVAQLFWEQNKGNMTVEDNLLTEGKSAHFRRTLTARQTAWLMGLARKEDRVVRSGEGESLVEKTDGSFESKGFTYHWSCKATADGTSQLHTQVRLPDQGAKS
jgi:hypothetical protein